MMNTMEQLFEQLLAKEQVHFEYKEGKTPYHIPALPAAQCIVIPVIREVIAPIIIRNNDDMITDIRTKHENNGEVVEALRVRMIASKTKGVERRRGSQILRSLGAEFGGKTPANKAYVRKEVGAGEVFDLNDFIFGHSAKGDDGIYPVHAAVLYSDALSVQPKKKLEDDVSRQGGISEDGGNFDAEKQGTGSNIFTTYAILPGALFVQSLVMIGRRMTRECFNHLLLSIGLAGSYGGATATTGTNLRTHLGGVYWGNFERAINAPQEMLKQISSDANLSQILVMFETEFTKVYPHSISAQTLQIHTGELIKQFEANDADLRRQYAQQANEMKFLFNAWFTKTPDNLKGKTGNSKD